MRLPAEILQQILEEAVEALPFAELFRARLVTRNTQPFFNHQIIKSNDPDSPESTTYVIDYFAEEILRLLPKSARFQTIYDEDYYESWRKFPFRFKRPFFLRLIRQWSSHGSHGPCNFTHWAHEMLKCSKATELIAAGRETRETLIEKLADAAACSYFKSNVFYSEAYLRSVSQHLPERVPIDVVLQSVLACSAIQRGDCVALQRVLDGDAGVGGGKRLPICFSGGDFGIDLLEVTARMGHREIVSFIAKRGCPDHGDGKSCMVRTFHRWDRPPDPISVAARRGNREFLEVWLDEGPHGGSDWDVRGAYLRVVMIGRVQILEFLESRYTEDLAELRFHGLVAAIKTGQVGAIKWFIDRGALPPSIIMLERRISYPKVKPLLLTVLQDCNCKSKRSEIMKTLLETAQVNPNERHPSSGESILWCALKQRNLDIAMLLLNYGAAVDKENLPIERPCWAASCFGSCESILHYHWPDRRVSLLMLALDLDSPALLQRLLVKGMRRSYYFRYRIYCLKQDSAQIKNIERCLMEIGLDEDVVKEEPLEYCILDTDGLRRSQRRTQIWDL